MLLREMWHGAGESAAASGDIYSLKSWAIADLKEDLVAAGAPTAARIREGGGRGGVVPLTMARFKEHDATAAHGGARGASRAVPPAGEGAAGASVGCGEAAAAGEAAASGEAAAGGGEAHESAVVRGTVPAWVSNQFVELTSRAASGGLEHGAPLECAQLSRPKPGKSARPKSGAKGAPAVDGACGDAAAPGIRANSPMRVVALPSSPPRLGSRRAPLSHREAPQPSRSRVKVSMSAAAHESTHHYRNPPACSGLPPGPEKDRRHVNAEVRSLYGLRSGALPSLADSAAVGPAGRAT